MDRDLFLQAAIDEAKLSFSEGGIPIGSVLVSDGKIIGRDTIAGSRPGARSITVK